MAKSEKAYLPAAGRDWLLPFYDPMVKLLGADAAQKQLLEQASLQTGQRVLDIGCGTGRLTVLIKRIHPDLSVNGVDPDAKALARARAKATRSGLAVEFTQGFGDDLPYTDAGFERVFSAFMFHHLPSEEKLGVLREVHRVLAPGGEFHLLDFEGHDHGGHGLLRLFHAAEQLKDNTEERVIAVMRQAGFRDAKKTGRRRILIGTVAYYRGTVEG